MVHEFPTPTESGWATVCRPSGTFGKKQFICRLISAG